MPTYEIISGTHVHGTDADGNRRVFRAARYPQLTPGGSIPGGGEVDPLFKEGDQYIKTNRTFKVVEKGRAYTVTLDQRHPNKFRLVDPAPVPEEEEMLFTLVEANCKACAAIPNQPSRFKVRDTLIGKQVLCPRCQNQVTVTPAQPVSAVVSQAVTPKSQPQLQQGQATQSNQSRKTEPTTGK